METKAIEELERELDSLRKINPKTKSIDSRIQQIRGAISRTYNQSKAQIMKAEERNFSHLFLLRSNHGFYKMCEHSAIFYAASIAPKLGLVANLQPDGDYEYKSKIGIVSIKNLEGLRKYLEKLNITQMRTKDQTGNLIAFKLPWTFTEEQLEKFIEEDNERLAKFNRIVMTSNVIPALYVHLMELCKATYENARRITEPVAKDTLGVKVTEVTVKMIRTYMSIANGRLDTLEGAELITARTGFSKSGGESARGLKNLESERVRKGWRKSYKGARYCGARTEERSQGTR